MFTLKEKEAIRAQAGKSQGLARIRLVTTSDPRGEDLERFVESLADILPGLDIRREKADPPDLPALWVGRRIRYHALPLGPELSPFLDALTGKEAPLAPGLENAVKAVKIPAPMQLFIAPQCPHCPEAVRTLIALAAACKPLTLAVIDAFLFSESAETEKIRSVPTAILDSAFRWTGVPDPGEIVRVMTDRDPAAMGAQSLRSIIETGDAEQVARMMHQSGKLFPAFFDLIAHEKWPVRLGAMVVMEYLAEIDPGLAAEGADPIWRQIAGADEQIQGDLLDVLGMIAPLSLADPIEVMAKTNTNGEIREAAREAADRIWQRHGTSGKSTHDSK